MLTKASFFCCNTVVDLLRRRTEFLEGERAFVFLANGEREESVLTYGELDRRARAIAAMLQTRGLAGQRALLLYPAGLDFVAAFYGCLYAGVVAVTAYPPRRNRSFDRIQAIVNDSGAKVALTTATVFEQMSIGSQKTVSSCSLEWILSHQTPTGIEDHWNDPGINGDTLAVLQYTSGSTGAPKGVMLSHANLLHNSALIAFSFEHSRSSTGVFWLPSYHDMGLVGGILQPIFVGGSTILMSPMAFLQKPLRWLAAISHYRATTSGGPNFAYDLCVRKIKEEELGSLDLSSWRIAFNGAEPVRSETLERFANFFAPCGFRREFFYPCYGLAEATLLVSGGGHLSPPKVLELDNKCLERGEVAVAAALDGSSCHLVGCGQNLPDQRISIVNPDEATLCPSGKIGEVWVKGPSVAQGYWQRDDETAATFAAYLRDSGDGPFLRTGDLGFLHEGELYIAGRLKDLIIVNGVNHHPQDIELTIERCGAAVRPHAGAAFAVDIGGRAHCVVVQEIERCCRDDARPIIEAIRTAVSQQHDLHLDAIVLLRPGSIPTTSSGKIQRHACRRGFADGQLKVVAEWRSPSLNTTNSGHLHVERGHTHPTDELVRPTTNDTLDTDSPGSADTTYANNHVRSACISNEKRIATPDSGASECFTLDGRAAVFGKSKSRSAGPGSTATFVIETIRSLLIDPEKDFSLDTKLSQLGLDSLQRIELQGLLEENFGIRFSEEEGPNLESVGDIVVSIETHLISIDARPQPPTGSSADVPLEHYQIELYPEYINLRNYIGFLEGAGAVNPYFKVHQALTADTTVIDGRSKLNFSSFNYLGMSGDPIVMRAAKEAIERYGTSASASRLVSGEKQLHQDLEEALAQLTGAEDALALVGGHATNVTTIGHLFGSGDLILHDELAHNSIVQGSILSHATRYSFPHNDWEAVEHVLSSRRSAFRRVLIAVDGVYSMDGDIADLPRFVELKQRYKTWLLVDEAHSSGVLGLRGRGAAEHFGLRSIDVDIWMGTLSKAWGSCGGFVAGRRELIEYLKYTAPGFVYSVGMTPPDAAAALAAVRLAESQPQRIARLRSLARLFLDLARGHGLDTGSSRGTPIVPILVGDSLQSLQLSQALFERGINVQPIVRPAVEEKSARLRFFITSSHSEDQIRYTIKTLVEESIRIGIQCRQTRADPD